MDLYKLLGILEPPLHPKDVPTDKELLAFATEVTPLPKDYEQFIKRYGTGCIDGFIWIYNPTSDNDHLSLPKQMERQLSVMRDVFGADDHLPYDVRVGGEKLLPFGSTENGDLLLWLKLGTPESWTVVVLDAKLWLHESYDLCMTEFLFGMLTGVLRSKIFPVDFPSPCPVFVAEG